MTELNKPDFQGRFLTAVRCQGEPDRVPLVEAGIDAAVKTRFLGRPIRTLADEAAFWAAAGYDFVPLQAGLRTIIDAAIHHEQSGRFEGEAAIPPAVAAAKDFAVRKLSALHLSTEEAGGSLRTWAPEGKGFVNTLEDLEAFPWPAPHDLDYTVLQQAPSMLPPGLGVVVFAGAIFSSVMLMMGIEECWIGITLESDLFRALVQRVGEFQVEVVRRLLDIGAAGAIWINDDLGHKSGTFVNPKLYRKYIFPFYEQISGLTKAHGLPLMLHSDGRITEILPDLVALGFNAIHPIEAGAMDIEETRRTVGMGVCLIGNLSLGYPLGTGTPEQVARETESLICQMAPGGSYCLSSGNSIPDYIPYENWDAMRSTALRVGVYPIQATNASPGQATS